MSYQEFRQRVLAAGWTIAQLRCDVPPSRAILDLMDEVGLDCWERYVNRMERKSA